MNKAGPSKPSKSLSYKVSSSSIRQSTSAAHSEVEGKLEEGNLEKVRDILFGAQSREFEHRFAALESQLREESATLRADLSNSVDELKQFLNGEVQRVAEQFQKEQSARTADVKDVRSVIEQLGKTLEERLSGLDSKATQQFSTIEVNLTQQKQEISDSYSEQIAQLQAQVDQGFQELKADKTDRAVLSEMLMDLAVRLKASEHHTQDS